LRFRDRGLDSFSFERNFWRAYLKFEKCDLRESSDMSDQVQEGDKVSWSWNDSHPSGTVAEVEAGEVTVTSHRGNEIKKTGDEQNLAVHVARSGNDVVKMANELEIEKKADGASNGTPNGNSSSETKDEENKSEVKKDRKEEEEEKDNSAERKEDKSQDEKAENGDTKAEAGDKRKADETEATAEKKAPEDDEADSKKQKTNNGKAAPANGEKKKPGRPKGSSNVEKGAKKEKKAPAAGRAERKTRSQGNVD